MSKPARMSTLDGMQWSESTVTVIVLGMMQDGGLPHIGCECRRCRAAFADPALAGYAAALAVVDRRYDPVRVWIIDATPDIKWQLAMLSDELGPHPRQDGRLRQPDGIFLTHAHMGHIGGMPQLGPEAMAVHRLPLYATPTLLNLLRETDIWRPVLSDCVLKPLLPGQTIDLALNLGVTAIPVPHRDEWGAGTVAYRIEGPRKTLLYVPDIDDWDSWPQAYDSIGAADLALVDASFYSSAELGGRTPVAHPLVPDTLERFTDIPGQLVLTHINHTNPILDRNSPERQAVLRAGVQIARRGREFSI